MFFVQIQMNYLECICYIMMMVCTQCILITIFVINYNDEYNYFGQENMFWVISQGFFNILEDEEI